MHTWFHVQLDQKILDQLYCITYSPRKSTGQSGPQLPQFSGPPTCTPESSTNVEHHGVGSPAVVHWWDVIPSNLKGKMHNAFGFGPLTVEQFSKIPLSVMWWYNVRGIGVLENILLRGCAIYPEARSAEGYIAQPWGTQPVWTLFLFKSIWIRPQGYQGCHKIRILFSQIELLSFCANIAPKRQKLRKTIKIEKKCKKTLVFWEYFKSSSFWGQYQRTNLKQRV